MPLAVTHVLIAIILVDLYRDYFTRHKDLFSLHTILVAGFAGLLPDIDIPLNWFLDLFGITVDLFQHGGITHTPFFGLLFIIPGLVAIKLGKDKLSRYFFVMCAGVLIHLALDLVSGGGNGHILVFWPFSMVSYKIGLYALIGIPNLAEGVDAIILLAWLYHEEVKHKIIDFI